MHQDRPQIPQHACKKSRASLPKNMQPSPWQTEASRMSCGSPPKPRWLLSAWMPAHHTRPPSWFHPSHINAWQSAWCACAYSMLSFMWVPAAAAAVSDSRGPPLISPCAQILQLHLHHWVTWPPGSCRPPAFPRSQWEDVLFAHI